MYIRTSEELGRLLASYLYDSSMNWVGEYVLGEVAPWATSIDPFPAKPTVTFQVSDERMKKSFAPVTVSTPMPVCATLVDLTGNPATPPYAGVYDEEMILPEAYRRFASCTPPSRCDPVCRPS